MDHVSHQPGKLRRGAEAAGSPCMLFPSHPPESTVLLRFLETEATMMDKCSVMASSLLLIGAFSWLPVFSVWAYKRWKKATNKRQKALYGACLLGALSMVVAPFGSRRMGDAIGVRHWKLWTSWLRYLAVEVIEDSPPTANAARPIGQQDPAIVAVFSHGIFPFSLALAALPQLMAEKAFGFIRPVVASATRYLPLVNVVLSWIGKVDASRRSVNKALSKGDRIGLIPGGIAEIYEGYPKSGTHPDTEYAIVRRGFLKMAVRHGIPVIPVYCFGSTKLFRRLESKTLQRLSNLLKASVVVFYGICGLPIPFRQKLSYIIGSPIHPPACIHSSDTAVDQMYASLCDELQRLFERHKGAYGWERKNLELLDR